MGRDNHVPSKQIQAKLGNRARNVALVGNRLEKANSDAPQCLIPRDIICARSRSSRRHATKRSNLETKSRFCEARTALSTPSSRPGTSNPGRGKKLWHQSPNCSTSRLGDLYFDQESFHETSLKIRRFKVISPYPRHNVSQMTDPTVRLKIKQKSRTRYLTLHKRHESRDANETSKYRVGMQI